MRTFLAMMVLMFSFSTISAVAAPDKKINRKMASEEIKCSAKPNEGIGIDPDYIVKQVKAASSCYQASAVVENCGAGSSMDSITTGAAIEVCDKLTGKLSASDNTLKKSMLKRCAQVCSLQDDGTMCIAQQAFCRLDVSKFLNTVNMK